jgi:flagellar biosynthesis/type III secretory pathway protein FliH
VKKKKYWNSSNMTEVTLRLNRPISGIKELNHARKNSDRGQQSKTSAQANPDIDRSLVDAHTIKILKDRLNIVEKELQHAREESFLAGYEEGKQSVMQEAQKYIEQSKTELQNLEKDYREAIAGLELPLLKIARKMAREALAEELQLREDHEEILINRLRRMLQEVVDQNKAIIQINPEQLARLDVDALTTKLKMPHKMEMRVVGGKGIGIAEAIIQTEDYYLDGAMDSQLARMEEQLIQKAL